MVESLSGRRLRADSEASTGRPPLADDGKMSLMPHVEHEGPKTEIAEYGSTG